MPCAQLLTRFQCETLHSSVSVLSSVTFLLNNFNWCFFIRYLFEYNLMFVASSHILCSSLQYRGLRTLCCCFFLFSSKMMVFFSVFIEAHFLLQSLSVTSFLFFTSMYLFCFCMRNIANISVPLLAFSKQVSNLNSLFFFMDSC